LNSHADIARNILYEYMIHRYQIQYSTVYTIYSIVCTSIVFCNTVQIYYQISCQLCC